MEKETFATGIIGGMGTEATKHLFELVIEKTKAESDADHIPLCILNDTLIPDRTAHIMKGAPSPLKRIMANVETLQKVGVASFAIPCNTAHMYSDRFKTVSGMHFIDMVDATLKRLNDSIKNTFVLLATKGTLQEDVYKRDVLFWEKNILYPEGALQETINDMIYAVKAGADKETIAREFSERLRKEFGKNTAYVLGCTELSLLKEHLEGELDCFSSLDILAEEIVSFHETWREKT